MNYLYAGKKRADGSPKANAESTVPADFSPNVLRSAIVRPTQEMLGRPVDLPGAIRAKMETSFGADLSAVRLYESQAVADAGAQAVAQGSRIAFAPGALDFSSASGQALLGHELSHVVSQARGEVTGSGFLNDSALEARADREGAMAAAGQPVYAGPVTAVLSSASAIPAAGPMQAKKFGHDEPMEISEPELIRGPFQYQSAQPAGEDGTEAVPAGIRPAQGEMHAFQNSRNAAIHEMVMNATPEQARDPALRKLVLDAFNPVMNQALLRENSNTKQGAFSHTWRSNSMGELDTYNLLLKKLMQPHLGRYHELPATSDKMEQSRQGLALTESILEDDPDLQQTLSGTRAAFTGSTHYSSDEAQSEILMSNLMLRGISDQLSQSDPSLVGLVGNMTKGSSHSMSGSSLTAMKSEAGAHYNNFLKRLWNRT